VASNKGVWIKVRKPIAKYPETPQQKKVKVGGEMIRRRCTGLKGEEFADCRSRVLKCAFDDEECEGDLLVEKRFVEVEEV